MNQRGLGGKSLRRLTASAAAAALLALAGCGKTPAAGGRSPDIAGAVTGAALATSQTSGNGTGWAVVGMGGPAAQAENFWELFARPAGAADWKLATPAGVATNGGIVAEPTGPSSLVAGIRPSERLTFSPLAATTDSGANWSQNTLVSPGLADVPGALAGLPDGTLLALTDAGGAVLGSRFGAQWSRLTTESALAKTGAGRDCGLLRLTAAAMTSAGAPLLAGACLRPGRAGVFTLRSGSWQAIGPAMPGALAGKPVTVLGMSVEGTRVTALLAAGSGKASVMLAAWSADDGSTWTVSPALPDGAGGDPAVSFQSAGSADVVFGGRGAAIGWQSANWQTLPPLPAGTATLAATGTGRPEALVPKDGTLKVWQLATGSGSWTLVQTAQVPIPYGSSG